VTQFGPTLIMNINPVTLVEVEPKKGLRAEG
jgi:hypothetical protein